MVTVVIPVYNVEDYLEECLDSVIAQTYTDLQIIIVDDGSTDRCGEICDAYALRDSRVQVIHQENRGLSAARNLGIELAGGKYLIFVDGDDFILPDCIEKLLGISQRYNADMSVCTYDIIRDGARIFEGDNSGGEPEILTGRQKMATFLCVAGKVGTTAWGKLYRAELFREIRYPVGMLYEDVYPMHQLVHAAKRIALSRSVGWVYRKRPGSITTSAYSEKKLDRLMAYIQSAEFIRKHCAEFLPYARSGILDTCVGLVSEMAREKAHSRAVEAKIQKLCREHFWAYMKYGCSRKVKIFAVLLCAHVGMAKAAAYIYWKIRGSRMY